METYFKRRTAEQIRERYINVLAPDKKVGPWTPQEDRLLIAMIKKYGYGHWKEISEKVPGRDDHKCLLRAKHLLKKSIEYHSERGKEYDPGIYDPELFAKILRPLPLSSNLRKDSVRYRNQILPKENALKMLVKALEKLVPEYVAGIQDLNAINVSWMNSEMLHKLSDLLHASLPEIKKHQKVELGPSKYLVNPPCKQKRVKLENDIDSDDDDNNDEKEDPYFQSLPIEEAVSQREMYLVQSAMLKLLEMQDDIMQPPHSRLPQDYGPRETAEMSLYTAYLSKEFHCCKTECDDKEEVVFDKVNYRESLKNVTEYFIQPPVYENQFIILAPNATTMTGMEVVEATEDQLLSMSECASHSKPYIDYLCERKKSSPQCLQCLHKLNKTTSRTTPESVMSEMIKRSFLPDERMIDSALIEDASVDGLNHSCSCKALDDSKKSVQLLRKRFLSLFTWPALFSAVGFSEKQEHLFHKKPEDYDSFSNVNNPTQYQKSRGKYKRKRQASQKDKSVIKPKLEPKTELQESEFERIQEGQSIKKPKLELKTELQESGFERNQKGQSIIKPKLELKTEFKNLDCKSESKQEQSIEKPKLEPKAELQEPESETDSSVSESERESNSGSESGTESGSESGTESGSESGTEAGSESGLESGTESEFESGKESECESQRESESEFDSKPLN